MEKIKKAIKFNKKASSKKFKPEEVIKKLNLRENSKILDLGAGGGFYSLRFAEIAKMGYVYAVDIEEEYLKFIQKNAEEKGLKNLITIKVDKENFELPEKDMDLIFIRNVTHHIKDRADYFKRIKKFLKPNGRIVIIDYKKINPLSFHFWFGHYIRRDELIREMEEAGFKLEEEFNFLKEQYFFVFKLKI